jgi:uncharacterized protein (DUF1501 family)
VRIVTIDAGGWDTHSNGTNRLSGLAGDLAASLFAFHQDLGTDANRTLLLGMTEFLYQERDLQVTTDFRDVFAEVLDRHLGISDPSPMLPNHPVDPARYPGLYA